jgi:glycosyltransferase involved in cell wall biosynthesis
MPPRPSAPPVSVVIPTYNRAGVVIEAVASVLAQEPSILEVLVVDDGSTDDTVARLRALGPPVQVIPVAHSGIPGRVRNVGIRQARGELVAFLDSDDLWLPGKLARQLAYLAAHPHVGLVYTDEYFEERGRRLPRTRFADYPPRDRFVYQDRIARISTQLSSVLVGRVVLKTVSLFDEGLRRYEDADLLSRISERYALGFITEPLVVYRMHVDSLHLTADEWLRVEGARRYLTLYHARRDGRPLDPDELDGVRRFERELAELEGRLGLGSSGAPA